MESIVQKIPFLRPTLALACGILTGVFLHFSIAPILIVSCLLLCCSLFLNNWFSFRLTSSFGISIHLLFISIGILAFTNFNRTPTFVEAGVFIGTIQEKPQEKKNSFKSLIKLSGVKSHDVFTNSNERLLVYFSKSEAAKNLSAGDRIIFTPSPQIIKNYGNPYEFDYKDYLVKKKIYRQVYLPADKWKKEGTVPYASLRIIAERFREKLLTKYGNRISGKNELEILSALTLGYKRELDPETKRVFSKAGAMHVLAVSGLHVGIIFWLITLLLGRLKKQKTGKILFILLSITGLWVYAFVTGLSPSVMRSSTMFSIFVIGDNLDRKASSYNSLAASAMFLLLVNPNNLFEVGFQLSYAAVFAILFLHPKLDGIFRIKNKFFKFIWSLISISIAAQVGTFPITVFYFNQFPLYFILTNLLVIPAAMLLIPLGVALLFSSGLPFLPGLISQTIQFIIHWVYKGLLQIEQLPLSVLEFTINPVQLIFLIGALLGLLLFLQFSHPKFIKAVLFLLLLLNLTTTLQSLKQAQTCSLIVYNSPDVPAIHLINGRNNYVISQFQNTNQAHINTLVDKTCLMKNLNSPVYLSLNDSLDAKHFHIRNGFVQFCGKTMLLNKNLSELTKTISPDYILFPEKFDRSDPQIAKNTIIITNKSFYQHKMESTKSIVLLTNEGAFIENW